MLRYYSIVLLLMVGFLAGVCSCSKEDADRNKASGTIDQAVPNAGVINVIRSGKLMKFPSATIGEVFDSYKHLVNKEWNASPQPEGVFFIDFTGWLNSGLNEQERGSGVMRKGLGVTFKINADGSFYVFMTSMVEARSDGSLHRQQLNDVDGILTRIYGNKKIEL